MTQTTMQKFIHIFLWCITATMLYCYGEPWLDGKLKNPICRFINDSCFGEEILWIDVDYNGNAWVLSRIVATNEYKITLNGHITVWRSTEAQPGDPKNFKIIAAKSIKDFYIETSSDSPKITFKITGRLEGLTQEGNIYYWINNPDGTCKWVQDTTISQVKFFAVGHDGDAWVLSEKRVNVPAPHWQTYRRIPQGGWKANPGWDINCIALSDASNVHMLTNYSWIWRWNPGKNNWVKAKFASSAKFIALGRAGYLWDVALLGGSWRWAADGNWQEMGGKNSQMLTLGIDQKDGKEIAYEITCALVHQAAKKFEFQLVPDANIWEVYSRNP